MAQEKVEVLGCLREAIFEESEELAHSSFLRRIRDFLAKQREVFFHMRQVCSDVGLPALLNVPGDQFGRLQMLDQLNGVVPCVEKCRRFDFFYPAV
jgi:hypothetical protein